MYDAIGPPRRRPLPHESRCEIVMKVQEKLFPAGRQRDQECTGRRCIGFCAGVVRVAGWG